MIQNEKTERAATDLLLHYYEVGRLPFRQGQRLGRWLTMRQAEWIIDAQAFALLLIYPHWYAGEVRQFLSPHTLGLMEQQEQNSEELERQERERRQRRDEQSRALKESILRGTFWEALNALATKDRRSGQYYLVARLEFLAKNASDRLQVLNLPTTISYGKRGSWHEPPEVQPILRMVDHYEVRLDPDETLVWTLKAWPGIQSQNHYKRWGFSANAVERFVEFSRAVHERATSHENVLAFLEETNFTWPDSPKICSALFAIFTVDILVPVLFLSSSSAVCQRRFWSM